MVQKETEAPAQAERDRQGITEEKPVMAESYDCQFCPAPGDANCPCRVHERERDRK